MTGALLALCRRAAGGRSRGGGSSGGKVAEPLGRLRLQASMPTSPWTTRLQMRTQQTRHQSQQGRMK